jgi:hypothetical protein
LAPQITPDEEILTAVLLFAIQVSPPAGPSVLLVSAGTPPEPMLMFTVALGVRAWATDFE